MNPEPEIAMTQEAYFQLEAASDVRYEFIGGQIYAMGGSALNHNRIAMNVAVGFSNHLRGTSCETFSADMKVQVGNDYVYPDVVVDCHATGNLLVSPIIIVEVLSKSTRKKDTTQKLIRYINLPSLQEYVLVEQDIVSVQVFRRIKAWQPDYYYLGDSVTFDAIGVTLTVDSIYERVDNTELNEFWQLQQGVAVKSSE